MENYLGKFMSVVTKAEVRVEGDLSHVDMEDSIIVLRNASCFGTEQRRRKKKSKIKACGKLDRSISLKIKHIKEAEIILFTPPQVPDAYTKFPPLNYDHSHL